MDAPGILHVVSLAALAFFLAPGVLGEEAGAPILGVMTHFAQGWDTALAPKIAAAGVRDVRDEVYWQDVEPEPGRFRFPARCDRYMAALRRSGITPLVELTFANRGYDGGLTPYTDAGIAAYARYGTQVLRHYGRQIGAVEVWNEYNGSFCKGPAASDRAATYLRMDRAAFEAVKRERPDVLVAGCATAGIPFPYLEHLFSMGALDYMDAVSVHPYRYGSPPEGIEDDMAALRRLIDRYARGRPRPIWVTEIGWGTTAPGARGLQIDEETQAAFLVRAYALLLSSGAQRVYWYLFRDTGSFATMGLVHGDRRGSPKPAYGAMRAMIGHIGGCRFLRREPSAEGVYSIVFQRPDASEVRVIWSLTPRTVTIPASCPAATMLGRPIAPGDVTLGGEPIFVSGPYAGLPEAPSRAEAVLADSRRDFSGEQGACGWTYGAFVGDTTALVPLARFHATDWKREWVGDYPFLCVTDVDQHPSHMGQTPVSAVRRWTSASGGPVRITARFGCGPKGGGVTVRVLVEGQQVFSEAIGGPYRPDALYEGALVLPPGGAVDLAVSPGPSGSIDYAATQVEATVRSEEER